MKKLFIILLFLTGVTFSQNQISKEKITNSVENILELSKSSDYKNAVSYIVYTGSDENRKYKSKLNSNNSSEVKSAERMLKKIQAYLHISDCYEIAKSEEVDKSGTKFTVVNVAFISGQQKLNIQFEFVQVNDDLLLADIE